jgi:eukaryotic-like serine/threonine-protein kinase
VAEPGQVLAGRYELLHVLGRGGMATVYRAHDRELAREVAVKVLDPSEDQHGDVLTKFRREARSAATLNHRNVVAIHDVGGDHDEHFIVMELVEGVTLENVIRDRGPLEPARALAITQGILSALGAAHSAGLVHRDVKPGNVMFDTEGAVKVADFGLARSPASRTDGRRVHGSAPFMAPEQAQGGPLDPRTDIYAVGSLLYAMLTGRPPFQGKTDLEVLWHHLHDPPPRASDSQPDLPGAIDVIVLKALAKDPAERYTDVEDFRSDIDRVAAGLAPAAAEGDLAEDELMSPDPMARSEVVLDGRPGSVSSEERVPITSARVRGRKRVFGVVLLLLAAVIALVVLLFTAEDDPPREAAELDAIESLAIDQG